MHVNVVPNYALFREERLSIAEDGELQMNKLAYAISTTVAWSCVNADWLQLHWQSEMARG
jgi:hypothetical protein